MASYNVQSACTFIHSGGDESDVSTSTVEGESAEETVGLGDDGDDVLAVVEVVVVDVVFDSEWSGCESGGACGVVPTSVSLRDNLGGRG